MKHYNLAVIGGGLAGAAAAISAARQGLCVLLAEQSGALGGAMSNCLVYPFMLNRTKNTGDGTYKNLSAGIFAEFQERYRRLIPAGHKNQDPNQYLTEYFKIMLDTAVEESGADILFHARLFQVKTEQERIQTALFAVKSGVLEVSADFFIDATGDGDLLAYSGCEFMLGRESDHLCQPMTTCFRAVNVAEALLDQEMASLQALYKQYRKEGKIQNPREDLLLFRGLGAGIIHFNSTRIIRHNPVDPFELSRAEIQARKQVMELFHFLQVHSKAFADSILVSVASDIGVRESRKLAGEHVLTADELKACTKFEDSIAAGNYDIDIHNPEGSGTSHYYFRPGEYYTIPYRSLLPKEFVNLLAAGRCISVTHEAQASVRIMPICCCLGEAAGTAAGLALNTGNDAKTLPIGELRRLLKENNAVI